METIFAILTVIVYILLALVGLVALTICVFLWMVSTRTRQDSKIFQEMCIRDRLHGQQDYAQNKPHGGDRHGTLLLL